MLRMLKKSTGEGVCLLAGLGNPGAPCEHNRHNIGFMVVDAIAEKFGFPAFKNKFQGLLAEGKIDGQKVILLKPQTFMNNSGQSVAAAAKFFKIAPTAIYVFHDELDLAPGKIRIKTGGGNAGHNGLRSIDAHLGTADYGRVRLGIGHPGDKEKVHGYVLSDFSKTERVWLEALVESAAKNASLLIAGKEADYMTKVAQDVKAQSEGVN